MATPLSEEKRREFIEKAQKLGVPGDRILKDLARLEGQQPLVGDVFGQIGAETLEDREERVLTPEEKLARLDSQANFFERKLPRAAAATIGGIVAPQSIALQAAGTGLGDLFFQTGRKMLTGEEIKPLQSLGVAGGALLTGGILKGIIRASGAVGGIPPEAQKVAGKSLNPFRKGEGFRITFGRPAQEAELKLGERIFTVTKTWQDKLTVGRMNKVIILRKADASGGRIPVKPIVESIRSHLIPDATEASAIQFNKQLTAFANRLEARGPILPSQMDTLMIHELAPKAFTGSGKPAVNRFAVAIQDARRTARDTMELALGPEMVEANALAFEELTSRELADRVFGPSKLLSIETRLRNLFKPGHEAEQRILREIGREVGIDLEGEALRLSAKRTFTRDDRVSAGVLNRVFLLTGTPQIARGITKTLAPLQRLSAPFGGGQTAIILRPLDGRIRLQSREEVEQKQLESILINPPS